MRRVFTFIISVLLLSSGLAIAMPAGDNNDGQKTEQKKDKKSETKDEKKEEQKQETRRPPCDFTYIFAWPWIMR